MLPQWRAVVEGSSVAGSVHAVDSAVGETESRPQWSDFMVGTLKLAALAALLLTMNWAVQARFGKYVYAQARLAVSRSAKRRFLLARKVIEESARFSLVATLMPRACFWSRVLSSSYRVSPGYCVLYALVFGFETP